MTNAEKFKQVFGLYATELWAMPEKDFLVWLNADVPDKNVGDTISRQAAIDAIDSLYFDTVDDHDRAKEKVKRLPTAQPEIVRCKDCKHYQALRRWINAFQSSYKVKRTDGI